uniref:Uncharacterized protein n=1 Tax=Anguilla anguilla TaxID=7936 RepID=A0A0E9T5J3_ANGAN
MQSFLIFTKTERNGCQQLSRVNSAYNWTHEGFISITGHYSERQKTGLFGVTVLFCFYFRVEETETFIGTKATVSHLVK